MNQKRPGSILWVLISFLTYNHCFGESKTFFRPRSITQDSTYELATTNYHIYHSAKQGHSHFKMYVKPFYQESTNRKALAKYFLPNNQACVSIKEDGTGDIGSLWIDLISPSGTFYSSDICLHPAIKTYGGVFTFFGDFDNLSKGIWVSANMAIMKVQNSLRFEESNRTFDGTISGFTNAYQAFNNPDWNNGKIRTNSVKRAGVDNVEFKVGYNLCRTDNYHFGLYLVTTIPVGNKPKSKNLFEPLIGSRNPDIGAGFNADYTFFEKHGHKLTAVADLKYRYVFADHEIRSFDLKKNGEWSRYLLLVTKKARLNPFPGINTFSLRSKVSPRNTVETFAAIHYEHNYFNLEIGHNFWFRQRERIKINGSIPSNYAIFDLAGVLSSSQTSSSTANITQTVVGSNTAKTDGIFTPLSKSDLNPESAAHPNAASNKIYLNLSVTNSDYGTVGLGASYEFANSRNALSNWAIWLITGLAF